MKETPFFLNKYIIRVYKTIIQNKLQRDPTQYNTLTM